MEEPPVARLKLHGVPLVFVDKCPDGAHIAAVQMDYDKGITEAVQHLAVLGHRRIGFISGPKEQHSSAARLAAFRKAERAIGLNVPERSIVSGDNTVEGGLDGAEQLLRLPNRPTAILCSNDMTAIGAMHALSRAGLRIPDDISLVGFDDVHISQFMVPPMTTVRMPGTAIAHAAVALLKSFVDKEVVPQSADRRNWRSAGVQRSPLARWMTSNLRQEPKS